jgi:hypothetical protein
LFPLVATGVIDTGIKFAGGTIDTGGKFATGVVDCGGKFVAGVVDTSGTLHLWIFPRIFEKKLKDPNVISGGLGKMIMEKTWSKKSNDTVPLIIVNMVKELDIARWLQ